METGSTESQVKNCDVKSECMEENGPTETRGSCLDSRRCHALQESEEKRTKFLKLKIHSGEGMDRTAEESGG